MKKIASDFYGFIYSLVVSNFAVVILLIFVVIMLGFITKKMYSKPNTQEIVESIKNDDTVCIDKTSKSNTTTAKNSRTFTVEYVIYEKKGLNGEINYSSPLVEYYYEGSINYSRKTYPPRLIRNWSYKFNVTLEKGEKYNLRLNYAPSDRSTSTIKIIVDGNEVDKSRLKNTFWGSTVYCTLVN